MTSQTALDWICTRVNEGIYTENGPEPHGKITNKDEVPKNELSANAQEAVYLGTEKRLKPRNTLFYGPFLQISNFLAPNWPTFLPHFLLVIILLYYI